MDFHKKQKGDSSFNAFLIKTAAIFFIVVIIVLVVADMRIYKKRKGLEAEVAKYEKQIQLLKDKNKNLEERISNSDNSDYIEKIAREEQDMQKPGENVVSFVMPEEKAQEESNNNFWDTKSWAGRFSAIFNWIKKLF